MVDEMSELAGIPVLLVDDDAGYRMTLEALLDDDGARVHAAASVGEAKAFLSEHGRSYRLVIVDVHIGEQSGADVVRLARGEAPNARVVMVSGGAVEDADGDVPYDSFLLKTTPVPQLLAHLRALARGHSGTSIPIDGQKRNRAHGQ